MKTSILYNIILTIISIGCIVFSLSLKMQLDTLRTEIETCQNELIAERDLAKVNERIAREKMNEAIKKAELARQKAEEASSNQE